MTEEEEQEVGRGGYYYIVKPEDYYRNFKDSLKSSHSLETYSYALKEFMEYLGVAPSSLTTSSAASPSSPAYPYIHPYTDTDFAKLIEGKKGSITQIEDEIRDFIKWLKKTHHSRNSQKTYLAGVVKFYSMNRIRLNREWLSSFLSNDDVVINTEQDLEQQENNKDKAYSREQISKLLEFVTDLRTKIMILLMASSGMRVGALPILNFGDLTPVPEHQIYQIRVYTDSKSSQCYTFCTPECAKAIDNYLNYRRQSGERITRASPLFRREYNKRSEFDAAKNIRRIKDAAIKRSISKALYDSGLRTPLAIDTTVKLNNRRAIPMDNGFRRFFFTWCRHAGMDKFDIDWCMGHDIGVDESYFKPDPDSGIYLQILEGHHKKAGYLDAIDYLTINEEHRLKRSRTANCTKGQARTIRRKNERA